MIICVRTNRLTILQRLLIIMHEHNTILIASLRFKQFHNIVNMYGLVNNLNKSNYAHNIIMLLVFTHIADHTTTVAGIILVFVVSFDSASCCYGYCSLYFPALLLLLLLLLLVSVGLVVVGIELCYPLDLLLVWFRIAGVQAFVDDLNIRFSLASPILVDNPAHLRIP